MTKMTRTKAAVAGVLTAALLVGVGVGAHAQNRAQNAGRPAVQRNIDPAAIKARMDERHAARAAALHDLLAITPAQEGAWAAYQSAVRSPVHDGGRRGPGARQDLQGLTTPQRMDRLVQEANERHAEVGLLTLCGRAHPYGVGNGSDDDALQRVPAKPLHAAMLAEVAGTTK